MTKSNRGSDGVGVFVAVVVSLILLAVAFGVFRARMKADAFERVTGQHVSTWDAMFTDLRVVGNAGGDK